MSCGGRKFQCGQQDEGLCQKMCMVCMCGVCGEIAGGDGDGAMCTELLGVMLLSQCAARVVES